MKSLTSCLVVLLGFLVFAPANAASSCDTRELVVVELDMVKEKEVMTVNGVVPKSGAAFDEFFSACARKTVVLASPDTKISQLLNIRFFLGKIGLKAGKDNFFVFFAAPGGRTMTYMETFATIKYTNDKEELLKITENPPQESNWL